VRQNALDWSRWWRSDKPARDISSRVDQIRERQESLRATWRHAYRLYGNMPYSAFGYQRSPQAQLQRAAPLSWNVVANVIDTVHAEVVSGRPRAMFSTVGGDWSLRDRVKKLNQFVDGTFDACDVDETMSDVARDALTYGIGYVKVLSAWGRPRVERPMPWEVLVDRSEGRYRRPLTMYHVSYYDRWALASMFDDSLDENEDAPADQDDEDSDEGTKTPRERGPADTLSSADKRAAIIDAPAPSSDWALGYDVDQDSDAVLVIEAWRLPSGPGADDGRHMLTIHGTDVVLLDEPWEDDSFPIIALRWKASDGWHGQGIAEQLTGIQLDINYALEGIQTSHYLLSNARILVQGDSEVVPDQITNEIGSILRYFGSPPQCVTWSSVSPEMYQWVNTQKAQAFAEVGVSQMAASSLKPAGIDSGIALRTYLDTQSKRFIDFSRSYERVHIQIAKQLIREMRRLAETDSSYEVVYKDGNRAERIDWKTAIGDMDDGSYVVDCFPVSALPSTPSARLQTLSEMFSQQIIDRDTFLELSDMPDFESQRNLITAGRELVEKTIEHMLSTGKYEYPEAFYPLDLCVKLGGQYYLRAKLQGESDERLELLRQWIADSQALLAPPPAPDAPPADAGAMDGGPMPPDGMPPDGGPMPPDGGEPMPVPDEGMVGHLRPMNEVAA